MGLDVTNNDEIIRTAQLKDIDALEHLEQEAFGLDRFNRKQLHYLLSKARSTVLVLEQRRMVVGAAIILWRKDSSVGRLYSMVTAPSFQGHQLGTRLLQACENIAAQCGCKVMSLEVRTDNQRAISFYERHGYKVLKSLPGFYADGTSGFRMLKNLDGGQPGYRLDIPYYAQTLDFTCGPACLMMAMMHFDQHLKLNRSMELALWKEATLIFMTSGLGGCDPFGLAVAAVRRGYQCRVILSNDKIPFLSSVRSQEKKEVIRLVHEQLKDEAHKLGVTTHFSDFTFQDIASALRNDEVPIVLISTYRLHRVRAPHWVVVTGFDRNYIYCHDPYEGFYERNKRQAQHISIPINEFLRMHSHSKDVKNGIVFIKKSSVFTNT
jgi:ribosomal protein S18 acetylase RimI-like enzyme